MMSLCFATAEEQHRRRIGDRPDLSEGGAGRSRVCLEEVTRPAAGCSHAPSVLQPCPVCGIVGTVRIRQLPVVVFAIGDRRHVELRRRCRTHRIEQCRSEQPRRVTLSEPCGLQRLLADHPSGFRIECVEHGEMRVDHLIEVVAYSWSNGSDAPTPGVSNSTSRPLAQSPKKRSNIGSSSKISSGNVDAWVNRIVGPSASDITR